MSPTALLITSVVVITLTSGLSSFNISDIACEFSFKNSALIFLISSTLSPASSICAEYFSTLSLYLLNKSSFCFFSSFNFGSDVASNSFCKSSNSFLRVMEGEVKEYKELKFKLGKLFLILVRISFCLLATSK